MGPDTGSATPRSAKISSSSSLVVSRTSIILGRALAKSFSDFQVTKVQKVSSPVDSSVWESAPANSRMS